MLKRLMFIALFPVCLLAQTDWQTVQTSTDTLLWNVHFTDPEHGWAVGDAPIVVMTEDGGLSWNEVAPPYAKTDRLDVHFIDHHNGCIVGQEIEVGRQDWRSRPLLLHTSNGGRHWEETVIFENFSWWYSVQSLVFLKHQPMGWVAINHRGAPHKEESYLYQTTDGGRNWTQIHYRAGLWNGALCFIDKLHGYSAWSIFHDNFDSSFIEYTEDGGATWNPVGEISSELVMQLLPGRGDRLWARGFSLFYSDDGWNWYGDLSMSLVDMIYHRNLCIVNDQLMLLSSTQLSEGFPAYLLSSQDEGKAWQVEKMDKDQCYNGICAVKHPGATKYHDHYDLWVACDKGQLLHCKDLFFEKSSVGNEAILIEQNYPNPFKRSQGTQVLITLKAELQITITLFDLLGRKVSEVFRGDMPQGQHVGYIEPGDLVKDGFPLASGVYFIEVKSSLDRKVVKMVLNGD